jgi:hypothetical protein
MSLNTIISKELASALAELKVDDITAIVRAGAAGLDPASLYAGVRAVARGEDVPLPTTGGSPRPLTINAWSFVFDHGQYHDTYGLDGAAAGRLKDLLRTDAEAALEEITAVVTKSLRQRGSQRAVRVTKDGMPGGGTTDHTPAAPGRQGGAELKAAIRLSPALYGMYDFVAEDTDRPGPDHFRVPLGGGLYATFSNKRGAIDVARLCRVNGRTHPLCEGRVKFWMEGRPPVAGPDIPERVTFDGRLGPNERPPPNPSAKAKTEVAPREPRQSPPQGSRGKASDDE